MPLDREALLRLASGRTRHHHEGFGFRLHFNDVQHPGLLIAATSHAYARTGSFFQGYLTCPPLPIEVYVRSRYHRIDEPRAACFPPARDGISRVYLNLYNRDRLPLDSAYFWQTIRAILVISSVAAISRFRST